MNAIKILSNHKQQITIQTSASTLISKLKKDKSSCTAHKINAIKILAVYNPQTTFQTTTSILVSKNLTRNMIQKIHGSTQYTIHA